MFKRYSFLWLAFVFLLVTIANSAFGIQNVYLAKAPDSLKRIKTIKNLSWPLKDKINYLISNGHIQKLTPEVARELGFEWLNDSIKQPLPDLIVCYMGVGPEVGYGLFTMTPIKEKGAIAEYTGKRTYSAKFGPVKNKNLSHAANFDLRNTIYQGIVKKGRLCGIIDALHAGNAARFAMHLPIQYELSQYTFHEYPQANVATANSHLTYIYESAKKQYMLLRATRDIQPFEQIGFYYGNNYGSEYSDWPEDPLLFDKDGEIIPHEKYTFPKRLQITASKDCNVIVFINEELFTDGILNPLWKSRDGSISYLYLYDLFASGQGCTNCQLESWEESVAVATTVYAVKTCDIERIRSSWKTEPKSWFPISVTPIELSTFDDITKLDQALKERSEPVSASSSTSETLNSDSTLAPRSVNQPSGANSTRLLNADLAPRSVNQPSGANGTQLLDADSQSSSTFASTNQPSGASSTQLLNADSQSLGLSDTKISLPNDKESVVTLTFAADSSSENSIANDDSDDYINIRKKLLNLMNYVYIEYLENSNDSEKQLNDLSMAIANNAKLSPEQKGQLESILHVLQTLLTTKTAAVNYNFLSDIRSNTYGFSGVGDLDIPEVGTTSNMKFINKKNFPASLFVIPSGSIN